MIRSNRWRRAVATLAVAMAVLMAVLAAADQWLSLSEPVDTHVTQATPPRSDAPPALSNAAPTIDPGQLGIVIARPIFAQTRRPPLPPAPPAPAPAQTASVPQAVAPVLDFALVGIALVSEERVVLVQGPGEPARQLRRGETYRGWVLTAIGDDRAMFRNAGESKELVLDFTHGAPTP